MNMNPEAPPKRAGLLAALLSFVAGYVDTVGFIALFGLFTAHVTGNFVLIGAALVGDASGLMTKLLALPVFVLTVAVVTIVSRGRQRAGAPVQRMLLWTQTIILIGATAAAWPLQPLAQVDSGPTMLVGLLLVMAMAVQNCASKVAFSQLPPTTVMTGNVTQLVVDATDVVLDGEALARAGSIDRLRRFLPPILAFAVGAVVGGLVYAEMGFMALAGPALALALASPLLPPSRLRRQAAGEGLRGMD
jgi:uncharacterized membrane protein YoaK (UPF0700 family)